ncbi:protein lin-52 homolog isoform X1 [Emydura macquarii macquarii]|uniref:protein lin-52 homolog isoform X1 n=1 Tax=Emydura macquarii macquarii TaxID=1129001 RepID=UPI00352AB88A
MAAPREGTDLEASLLSFEKLDRASPDLWPEQLPGVAEFAASFKSPITNSPPKWMAELENDDIDMLKELGSLTTANLMEKVRGLQNLAYQLGLDELVWREELCTCRGTRKSPFHLLLITVWIIYRQDCFMGSSRWKSQISECQLEIGIHMRSVNWLILTCS